MHVIDVMQVKRHIKEVSLNIIFCVIYSGTSVQILTWPSLFQGLHWTADAVAATMQDTLITALSSGYTCDSGSTGDDTNNN